MNEVPSPSKSPRAQWNSRTGFILAAAGSAVGLGNIWKFPYITGENGGGAFVLVYLACILIVGVPVMVAEVMLGRASRSSSVNAYRALSHPKSKWMAFGILAIVAAFLLLSYYSTVAGWALHYTYLSLTNAIAGIDAGQAGALFGDLTDSPLIGVGWQFAFLVFTMCVVAAGVSQGIERWARIMMPGLFALILVLLGKALTMPGWGDAMGFLFGMNWDKLTAVGVLEALGHSFFTLSLGMGSMITYGSYLRSQDDLASASLATAGADTLVALAASMVLFPIVFTFGMEPGAGPGLLFVTLPTALAQMTGGAVLSVIFFVMLVFAALTSAIAILEVVTAYLVDNHGIARVKASVGATIVVALFGAPATISGGWFNVVDKFVSNWALPLGGLGVALFVAWRMDGALRRKEFESGSGLARFYGSWLWVLKYPVPVCIVVVFLHASGVL